VPLVAEHGTHASAFNESHVDVKDAVYFAPVMHRDDVRFLQLRGQSGLTPETILETAGGGELRAEQLDRNGPILDRVIGPIDLTHPARTDDESNLIGSEHRADARLSAL